MKAAKGSGIVSSFFTYTGSPWDEIDVEILGKNTNQAQLNYFVNGTGGHERLVDLGFDASAEYHTYAFDWQPNGIKWYVDGVLKHSVTGSTSTLPSHPMQIMMNLWNGIGVDGWLGPFNYSGPLYASYDYVTYTPPGSSSYALSVSKSGSGSGTITSNTGGINCGSTCSATFNSGTTVTLTASPASGSTFGGWSDACTGTGTCIVTMTAAQTVGATFTSSGGSSSSSSGGSSGGSSGSSSGGSSGSSSGGSSGSSSGGSSGSSSGGSSGSSSGGSSGSSSGGSSGSSSGGSSGSNSGSSGSASSGGSASREGATGCTTGTGVGGGFPILAAAALFGRLRRRPAAPGRPAVTSGAAPSSSK
jgi:hypothetical protein